MLRRASTNLKSKNNGLLKTESLGSKGIAVNGKRFSLRFTNGYIREWLWACDNCDGKYSAMSIWMAFCPGCGHERCDDCPVESVKKRCYVLEDEIVLAAHAPRHIPPPSHVIEAPKRDDAGRAEYFKGLSSIGTSLVVTSSSGGEQKATPESSSMTSPDPYASRKTMQNPSTGSAQEIESAGCATHADVNTADFKTKPQAASEIFPEPIEQALDAALLFALGDNFKLAACVIPCFHSLINVKLSESLAVEQHIGISQSNWEIRPDSNSESPHPEQPKSSPTPKRAKQTSGASSSDPVSSANLQISPNSTLLKRDRKPNDPEEPEEHHSLKRPKSDVQLPREIYACHFQKFNPQKFHPSTDQIFSGCIASSVPRLRRIHYHYEHVHRGPSCHRCFRGFKDTVELRNHSRQSEPCLLGPIENKEVIDDDQWQAIVKVLKTPQKSDSWKWFEIWDILFPGIDRPATPWNEPPPSQVEVRGDVRAFLVKFESNLEERIQPGALSQTALEDIKAAAKQAYESHNHRNPSPEKESKASEELIQTRISSVGEIQSPKPFEFQPPGHNDGTSQRDCISHDFGECIYNEEFLLDENFPSADQLSLEELNAHFPQSMNESNFSGSTNDDPDIILSIPTPEKFVSVGVGSTFDPCLSMGIAGTPEMLEFSSRSVTGAHADQTLATPEIPVPSDVADNDCNSSILEIELLFSGPPQQFKNHRDRNMGLQRPIDGNDDF